MDSQLKGVLLAALIGGLGYGANQMNLMPGWSIVVICGLGIFIVLAWDYRQKKQTTKYPSVTWLRGKEVMDKYGLSAIELYQHIKNGLPVYPKDFSEIMLEDEAQPLSEYDIGFEIEFDINHSGQMYDYLKSYHFKVLDVEQFLRRRNDQDEHGGGLI